MQLLKPIFTFVLLLNFTSLCEATEPQDTITTEESQKLEEIYQEFRIGGPLELNSTECPLTPECARKIAKKLPDTVRKIISEYEWNLSNFNAYSDSLALNVDRYGERKRMEKEVALYKEALKTTKSGN